MFQRLINIEAGRYALKILMDKICIKLVFFNVWVTFIFNFKIIATLKCKILI